MSLAEHPGLAHLNRLLDCVERGQRFAFRDTRAWTAGPAVASWVLFFATRWRRLERHEDGTYTVLRTDHVTELEAGAELDKVKLASGSLVEVDFGEEKNKWGRLQDQVRVTCSTTGAYEESWGHGDKSVRRCLALLRESCGCGKRHVTPQELQSGTD